MTRTIQKTVYTFDELSESAKEKARAWWRYSDPDNFFAESVIDDAVEIAKIIGIELTQNRIPLRNGKTREESAIYWSVFSSQGDGASFGGYYRYAQNSAKRIREYAPLDEDLHAIADRLRVVQSKYFYRLTASIDKRGRYCHEYEMRINIEYGGDDYREIDAGDEETIIECLRDFARWIYSRLLQEYEYQNANEQVDYVLIANGYEFDADGEVQP